MEGVAREWLRNDAEPVHGPSWVVEVELHKLPVLKGGLLVAEPLAKGAHVRFGGRVQVGQQGAVQVLESKGQGLGEHVRLLDAPHEAAATTLPKVEQLAILKRQQLWRVEGADVALRAEAAVRNALEQLLCSMVLVQCDVVVPRAQVGALQAVAKLGDARRPPGRRLVFFFAVIV